MTDIPVVSTKVCDRRTCCYLFVVQWLKLKLMDHRCWFVSDDFLSFCLSNYLFFSTLPYVTCGAVIGQPGQSMGPVHHPDRPQGR